MQTKTCTKCLINKVFTEFNKSKKGKYGLNSVCKDCWKKEAAQYRASDNGKKVTKIRAKRFYQNNPEKHFINSLTYRSTLKGKFNIWKGKAKNRKIEWNLTIEQIQSIPLVCHYTGQQLTLEVNKDNTVSLDRIDSSKGYEINNVVFCLPTINIMKNIITKEQFINLCGKVWNNFSR